MRKRVLLVTMQNNTDRESNALIEFVRVFKSKEMNG